MNTLFEQIRSTVDRLSGLAQALGDAPVPGGHGSAPLVPAERIEDAFSSVVRAARLELLEIRTLGPGPVTASPAARPGVRHRLIADPRTAGAAAAAARPGTEIRTARPLLALRAVVADREALALAVEVTGEACCLVADPRPEVAARFAARFTDDWWPRAHPYHPLAVAAESATEAAVLAALAEGLTDECVARRVGVTPRTVRRHVAAVSARFGAASRLQLGVLIGRTAATAPDPSPAQG